MSAHTFEFPSDGWTLTAVDGPVPAEVLGLTIAATVPGCAHTDLHDAALLDAPFDADNEAAQQWIGNTSWRYEVDFDWADDGSTRHDLVAQGLDTVSTIELNGVLIARTQNQHRGYRFDVGAALAEGRNHLSITFEPPVDAAEARSRQHGELPHTNHHPYNALRKMAANFGWDWGIDVATSGIWKPIFLESWSGVRIASVRPLVDVEASAGLLNAHVEVERDDASAGHAVEVTATVDGVVASARIEAGQIAGTAVVRVPDARLWWPHGHGEQPLYEASVRIATPSAASSGTDEWVGRIGFRTIEIDTRPDEAGTPFVVRVNGEAVQVRGANWIPEHAFLTRLDPARYARRIADATEANMNMLRVWGGGIYESDDFYDVCDEQGILVWQDFLFACAAYAEEEWLAEEVEAEARDNITRLSPHPSLAIWNGNNENIWGYVDWGWRARLEGRTWGNGYYRTLLPGLLAELDPTRSYSPASPYSFGEYLHPNDQHNGTMHIWDVWNERDYSVYRDYTPRFVSEFGFQAPPAWSTLTAVVHDEPLEPYGSQMLVHQKAHEGNLKLERGMRGHLPEPRSIDDWHWATQLNQAHALRFGIEHFRSLAPHNAGTIVWQLNDNWPVISWAAVDFDEHRKPLWYALRDVYRPRLATIQPRQDGLSLILLNDTADAFGGQARVRRLRFDGSVVAEQSLRLEVAARGEATVALAPDVAASDNPAGEMLVADFAATDGTSGGFDRATFDYAEVVDQHLDATPLAARSSAIDGGYLVEVTASSYVRDVFLQVDRVDPLARVDRGLLTLLAGESAQFRVLSDAAVASDAFIHPLVLRSANDLLPVAAR